MEKVNVKSRRKSSELFAKFIDCLKLNEGESRICNKLAITPTQFGAYCGRAMSSHKDELFSWHPTWDVVKYGQLPNCLQSLLMEHGQKLESETIIKVTKISDGCLKFEIFEQPSV